LVSFLLVEGLVLAVAGAIGGLILAAGVLELVRPLAPAGVPIPGPAELDLRLLTFTLGITAATVVAFALAPALSATRRALRGALAATRGVMAPAAAVVVVAEVALAVLLLVGSGLLIHSLWRLGGVEPGFALDDRIVADLSLSADRHPTDASVAVTLRSLVEETVAIPGVERAAAIQWIPLRGSVNWGFEVEGRTEEDVRFADYNLVGPDAFATLGISLIEGRGFAWSDLEPGAAPVVVISRAIAARLWPNQSALGRRLNFDIDERVWREVVGVVADIRNRSLSSPGEGLLYFPPITLPFASPRSISLVAQTDAPASEALAGKLRGIVAQVDPSAPLGTVASMRDVARQSLQERRFLMFLLSLFAGAAVTLSGIGLYGVLSQTQVRRTREIGVRVALGARRADVLRLIVAQTGRLVLTGLGLGLGAALWASRALESQLYEVQARDAATYAAVAAALVLIATLAAWLPARRAATVDPVVALRQN
jgi:predicted permease